MAAWVMAACAAASFLPGGVARGDEVPERAWEPQYLGMQVTSITQHLDPFPSKYSGPLSLPGRGDQAETDTWGLYLGARLTAALHAYLDVEMARGTSPGKAVGLGSLTNGDVIRIGSVNLGEEPYVARAYFRYTVPLGAGPSDAGASGSESSGGGPSGAGSPASGGDMARRTIGQLPGPLARERVEFKLGKFALTDDFDANRYANSTRTQFMSWSLLNNTAWDFAADTRGYTNGVLGAWIAPQWEARFAEVQVVTLANGNRFDADLAQAHSENLEVTVRTVEWGPTLRALAYRNVARMGVYREALAAAKARGGPPDITADERPGRRKYGYGLNVEQPLVAGGETGLFLRYGWSDGATESFMFTEVDEVASLGVQVCGCHWGREADRLGLASAVGALSVPHRDYLAAGGSGFLLGDGRLRYGPEQVTEVYYRIQAGAHVQISPDYQYYVNPGYNRDRGPAQVIGLRLRVYDL